VHSAKNVNYLDGSFSYGKNNVVLLINNKKRRVGTRVFT